MDEDGYPVSTFHYCAHSKRCLRFSNLHGLLVRVCVCPVCVVNNLQPREAANATICYDLVVFITAGSIFEKSAKYMFDDTCKKTDTVCHKTAFPQFDCLTALKKFTGVSKTSFVFKRVAYSASLADNYRYGELPVPGSGLDFAVVQEGMLENAFSIKFFGSGSCELDEGNIGQLGWRRVLMFSSILRNRGGTNLDMGDTYSAVNPYRIANTYEFSTCHQHYHFSHYGKFDYDGAPGSKRAFCIQV